MGLRVALRVDLAPGEINIQWHMLGGKLEFTFIFCLPSQVQIQAQIDDSHVVKILDTVSATETRQLFIIMEYCEGGNLLQWIRRNRKHKMLNEIVSVSSLEGIYIRKL